MSGWCGGYGCRERIDQPRGLCPSCRDRIRRAWERVGGPDRPGPRRIGKARQRPAPAPVAINGADVFDAASPGHVPAVERAAHLARWVARQSRAVRRADACRVAGVDPMSGSARRVLEAAEKANWIRRGERGAVLPGAVAPPS
jgi:hypothetical protein